MTVLDLVQRWAAAEQRNDATALDQVLADGFVGVGPFGFVLNRQQWLARFGQGLANQAVAVEEPQVHDHDGAAVVIGVLDQHTTHQGQDKSGRYRVTIVAVGDAGEQRVAAVHIGPLHDPRR
ncbi:ketosteroid isomerase-like protein [Hamadaea flava]|uniref:Nuclear transport factor 2 family protein n=1 Tax=Hamadaea flava TaxID=1742688 RepID=A0ABV8LWK3_9ACTN|nr:nuclear transport factor 2 family protein [Hamadaea flava]MCP2324609.1 ketosteroid isomerase-like protein [Hamadaea flava]